MSGRLWELGCEDALNLLEQVGHFVLDDVPDRLFIDCWVSVNSDVSEARYRPPLHLGIAVSQILGDVSCGLSRYLQVSNHCIKGLVISYEVLPAQSGAIADDLPAAVSDVLEIQPLVTRYARRLVRCEGACVVLSLKP